MARATWETDETKAKEIETAEALSYIRGGVWRRLPFKYMCDYAVCRDDKTVVAYVEIRWKNKHWPVAHIATAKIATLMNFDALGIPVYLCVADPTVIRWRRIQTAFIGLPVIWTGRNTIRDEMDCEPCFAVPDDIWTHYQWPAEGLKGDVRPCDNS